MLFKNFHTHTHTHTHTYTHTHTHTPFSSDMKVHGTSSLTGCDAISIRASLTDGLTRPKTGVHMLVLVIGHQTSDRQVQKCVSDCIKLLNERNRRYVV